MGRSWFLSECAQPGARSKQVVDNGVGHWYI